MLHVNQFCSNLSHSSLLKDISCIESGRSFKISEDNKFKKKCSRNIAQNKQYFNFLRPSH